MLLKILCFGHMRVGLFKLHFLIEFLSQSCNTACNCFEILRHLKRSNLKTFDILQRSNCFVAALQVCSLWRRRRGKNLNAADTLCLEDIFSSPCLDISRFMFWYGTLLSKIPYIHWVHFIASPNWLDVHKDALSKALPETDTLLISYKL